jgi:hypothetical protein
MAALSFLRTGFREFKQSATRAGPERCLPIRIAAGSTAARVKDEHRPLPAP